MMARAIRSEIAEFLNRQSNALAITLKYPSGPVSMDRIRCDLRDLQARADRKKLGRDFHKMPSAKRSRYWAVAEMLDVAPHVHSGWGFPSPEHANVLAEMLDSDWIWERRYAPHGGTHDVQPYDPRGCVAGQGWAGYAVKALITTDHMIISTNDIL